MKSKVSLSLIFSAVTALIFSFCFFEDNAKRIPVEETEEHFYEYVSGMEDLTEENEIDDRSFTYHYEDDSGSILLEYDDCSLDFNLYNYRENLFGEDYEQGIEKYNIIYAREFENVEDILNAENPTFKILSFYLSKVTQTTVSEERSAQLFTELKEKADVPEFDKTKRQDEFVKFEIDFEGQDTKYSLNYSANGGGKYRECIIIGCFGSGVTKQTP